MIKIFRCNYSSFIGSDKQNLYILFRILCIVMTCLSGDGDAMCRCVGMKWFILVSKRKGADR